MITKHDMGLIQSEPVIIEENDSLSCQLTVWLDQSTHHYIFTRIPQTQRQTLIHIFLNKADFDKLDAPIANKVLYNIIRNLQTLSVCCEYNVMTYKYVERRCTLHQ